MSGRDLIEAILKHPNIDAEIAISVDISTDDADAHTRCFTSEYLGVNDVKNDTEIQLLFTGYINEG